MNVSWKLCEVGFQWWIDFQFFEASRIARYSAFSAESSLGKMRWLRVYLRAQGRVLVRPGKAASSSG